MPKPAIKARKRSAPRATSHPNKAVHAAPAAKRAVGRPPRAPGFERRQFIVNAALLDEAMRHTGLGQSEVVNAALAHLAQSAAMLEGVNALAGAFPDHPGHGEERDGELIVDVEDLAAVSR